MVISPLRILKMHLPGRQPLHLVTDHHLILRYRILATGILLVTLRTLSITEQSPHLLVYRVQSVRLWYRFPKGLGQPCLYLTRKEQLLKLLLPGPPGLPLELQLLTSPNHRRRSCPLHLNLELLGQNRQLRKAPRLQTPIVLSLLNIIRPAFLLQPQSLHQSVLPVLALDPVP